LSSIIVNGDNLSLLLLLSL